MNVIKSIFSFNTLILIAGCVMLLIGILPIRDVNYDMHRMIWHAGMLEKKTVDTIERGDTRREVLTIKMLHDKAAYVTSGNIGYFMFHINIGDSLLIGTREAGTWGNMVDAPVSDGFRTNHDPNQIFHMVAIANKETLIDFKEYQRNLKKSLWFFPLISLIFFGWFFYRRSGWNNPFVTESSTISL